MSSRRRRYELRNRRDGYNDRNFKSIALVKDCATCSGMPWSVNSPTAPAPVERDAPPALALFRNLHQIVELARGQRLGEILELDGVGNQVAQSEHAVGDQHLLGVELLAHPPG